ncbi:MAG TPA: hypothetical protein VFV84_01570 [Burkholderiales bacterium]|nr:hypothetical protein [Burkholderiales bacterium]
MDIVIWIIAGGAIGWASLALLGMNEYRSALACVAIGAAGGGLGGKIIAPMLASPAAAGGFSFFALFVAALSAAACMALGNLLYKRFDI